MKSSNQVYTRKQRDHPITETPGWAPPTHLQRIQSRQTRPSCATPLTHNTHTPPSNSQSTTYCGDSNGNSSSRQHGCKSSDSHKSKGDEKILRERIHAFYRTRLSQRYESKLKINASNNGRSNSSTASSSLLDEQESIQEG